MNKKEFNFVPIYGTDEQISEQEMKQGQFFMSKEGKILFDLSEDFSSFSLRLKYFSTV